MEEESGFALWFTGPPAAGKSTLAAAVAVALRERGRQVQVLDSDELRQVLTPEPTYRPEERAWFYGVMVYLGHLLTQHGIDVLFAATANRRAYRAQARILLPRFSEIYVNCSLACLKARDPKGIYARVEAGEICGVPGIDEPYEPPTDPAVTVNTEEQTTAEGVTAILAYLAGMA